MEGTTKAKCVICGKPQTPKYKPFCSDRCADVDLHRWLSGGYRIPTDEAPVNGEAGELEDEVMGDVTDGGEIAKPDV